MHPRRLRNTSGEQGPQTLTIGRLSFIKKVNRQNTKEAVPKVKFHSWYSLFFLPVEASVYFLS